MIDVSLLRESQAITKELILRKEPSFDVDRLILMDSELRTARSEIEQLRSERNNLASQGSKGITEELRAQSIALGKKIKEKEEAIAGLEKEFEVLAASCPNIPEKDLPLGNKEANKEVRSFGKKPTFSFPFKNHVELNKNLDWFDFERAANMSGAQFVLYKNDGVKMIYALTRLMLKNNVKYGFKPIIPPYLVNRQALVNGGNLPKFEGDYYSIPEQGLCLIPSSEVNLTNMYAGSIMQASELPCRMTSWTSCFRSEAGGYGAQERGLIRIHQFEKVELYSICEPENSAAELERMVGCAEDILKLLGLHYRVSLLAAQDCSFQSAKTYDIEVWLPGQDRYYEVSSCSNCTDFQARRAGIRYRTAEEKKTRLVHTLNASSLALPRLMVALMECYQQEDGSIKLPEALQKEMDALW